MRNCRPGLQVLATIAEGVRRDIDDPDDHRFVDRHRSSGRCPKARQIRDAVEIGTQLSRERAREGIGTGACQAGKLGEGP